MKSSLIISLLFLPKSFSRRWATPYGELWNCSINLKLQRRFYTVADKHFSYVEEAVAYLAVLRVALHHRREETFLQVVVHLVYEDVLALEVAVYSPRSDPCTLCYKGHGRTVETLLRYQVERRTDDGASFVSFLHQKPQ